MGLFDFLLPFPGKGDTDFSLETFVGEFDGGAKSYLFEWVPQVSAALISALAYGIEPKYYVKAASLPGSDNEQITSYYKGMEGKWAGARRFSDWTVSFVMDKDGDLRRIFELWMSFINEPVIFGSYGDLFTNWSVQRFSQLGGNDSDGELEGKLTYEIVGAWPKSLGPATMDYSSTDNTVFDVTFAYQYHIVTDLVGSGFLNSLF